MATPRPDDVGGVGSLTEDDLVRECEHAIRERRKQERVANRLFNRIPCKHPSRGPNLREVLNYYGEKNRVLGEVRARPKPASAFYAGCADNGREDITDLPACLRPGSGFDLNDELRKDPGLIEEVRRRAAANIGVDPGQLQYINHKPAKASAAEDKDPSSSIAKLPDEIARGNLDRECDFCGHRGTRYRCSRCRGVHYCSAACQKRHWKASHHKVCKSVP